MSTEDWSEFYKTRGQKKSDGVEDFRRTIEAHRQNPSGVSEKELEATKPRMNTTTKDIDRKKARLYPGVKVSNM